VDLVDRTRASIQLAWLRLRLPGLLETESLDALMARLSSSTARTGADFAGLESALDRAEALTERLPLLPRTCLYRCLARYAVFRRHGFPVEFVMAISPGGVDEDGHAWLELDGKPYREERAADFLVSFRYPARAA
jgi:Transglutaminase-like superfamily